MKKEMIIRAWKDPSFRAGLSPDERAALPECPAGQSLTELDEGSLADVVGGYPAPDQDIHDFPPQLTPVIRVGNFNYAVRFDSVAALGAVAYRVR
jgi:mersacidin/lichenicidin family type 2 lantibiotic